jgi:hypothetical protein
MPTRNHILSRIKPKAKDFDNEIAAGLCLDYIKGPIARNNCQRPGGSSYRNTNCTCMQFLGLEQNLTTAKQVAEYMVRWASFSHTTKREILHERHRVSSILNGIGGRGRTYLLPMCTLVNADEDANGDGSVDAAAPAEEEGPIMVCKNGLQGLLCIGRKLWTSLIKNPGQVHGNTGKANKSKPFAEVYVSLTTFFEALEKEGSPFATRIIREETGTTMRDDDPNEVCLPPHITKHKCYARWCWERGWKVSKVSRT